MLEIVNQLDGFDARGNVKVRHTACCTDMSLHAAAHMRQGPARHQACDTGHQCVDTALI
jgi:hypothetical protein